MHVDKLSLLFQKDSYTAVSKRQLQLFTHTNSTSIMPEKISPFRWNSSGLLKFLKVHQSQTLKNMSPPNRTFIYSYQKYCGYVDTLNEWLQDDCNTCKAQIFREHTNVRLSISRVILFPFFTFHRGTRS